MKKGKIDRLMAYIVTLCMLASMLSGITFTVSAEEPVTASGIEFTKTAAVNPDGSIDITMEAYTTGTVTNESSAVPTDIILVIDVSGSMDEIANHESNRGLVYGEHYTYWTLFDWSVDAYGFNDSEFTYYKKNADESYTPLRYVGRDDNGFEYFTDGETRYYPILKDGLPSNRENGYAVIQFYREMTHMDILKEGASAFISVVEEKNAQITDDAKKHRISIVKFATADYWNGSAATDDHEDAVIGNNSNYSGYNYTQVVEDLTVVDADGETELLAAIDSLNPGGATAVDYGIQLAEDVLGDRPAAEAIGRSEAIIVFTDGSPTHGSNYEEAVAGSAIKEALALKQAGVKIFSIGGADNADSSILGDDSNRFMHYISNNYPNASYVAGTDDQPGTITPGEGSVSGGFYMTPSEDKNLESIFMDIFQQTVNLDITMGSTAGVIDTISPFFTIPDGANSVTLQVAEKTASGWADAVSAEGVEPRINGNTLTVRGFDFDANYVSEIPRMVDGAEFYGKKLIITINVTPDYDEIDLHKDSFEGGAIPTNEGLASVVNSTNEAVISVESPTVAAKTVTYMVDDEVYDYFYRFPGSEDIEVLDDISKTGHTFSGWTTSDVVVSEAGEEYTYTMPNADVVFRGSFEVEQYNVKYLFDGAVPDGAVLPSDAEYDYDILVPVEPEPSVDGYTFSGWYTDDVPVTNGEFKMPAEEVVFYGSFDPSVVGYDVEYYFENLDGDTDPDNKDHYTMEQHYLGTGTMGTEVRAELKTFEGFTLNRDISTISGAIKPDGSLVLTLYYARNRHDVTYSYIGDEDRGATPSVDDLKAEKLTGVKYGTVIDVIADPSLPSGSSYEFTGWIADNTDIASGTFTMPDADVNIKGSFVVTSDAEYRVEHYLENADGEFVHRAESDVTLSIYPGDTAYIRLANAFQFGGYKLADMDTFLSEYPAQTYNETDYRLEQTIEDGDPIEVFKLYYIRDSYTETYEFVNTPPDTTPVCPNDADYKYGEEVWVDGNEINIPGYTFLGWDTEDAVVENGKFTMPAHDVVIRGRFSPAVVNWKEEHYLMNKAGDGYVLDNTPTGNITHSNLTGTDITVHAGHYHGFVLNEDITNAENDENGLPALDLNNAVTTEVLGDGSLVIKFYYDRLANDVKYEIVGLKPAAVTVPDELEDVLYGTEVTVAVIPPADYPGYTFSGWKNTDGESVEDSFDMPAHDVLLRGSFTANEDTPYEVRYHLQKLNSEETDVAGTNKETDYELQIADTFDGSGTTGHTATAEIKHFDGFIARTDNTITAIIKGDGSTVINLYYDRVTNPINYYFYGAAPDHSDSELPAGEENVPYGVKRNVAANISCDASHRHIPTNWASPHVAPDTNGEFRMPATKVDFYTALRHIYKVEYDLNGGTGAADVSYATIDVFAGTVIDVKPAPTKASYTFTGWKLDGTDTIYNPDDEITVNEDVKLIAQYDYNGSPGGGGGGVTRYTLTYDTNGGSAIAKETHNSGKVVELTKVPKKDGYIFDGWHLDSALSEDVDEVKMTKNITVYADWVEDNGNAGNGHDTPGSLNGEDHFAYVVGYPDGTVRPNANIDRAEVTTIFFRLLKEEIRNGNLADTNSFKDVSDEDWHNTAISTMTKLGIVKGRYTDRFVPDAAITRAEFAVICARFDDSEYEIVDEFTDVQGHWAEAEIHEAAAHGWIRGYEDGTFKPDQFITRAEAMTMINRVLNRVPETVDDLLADMIKWSDNSDKSAWYYLPVQEATNSHDYDMKNHIYEKWTALRGVTDWTEYQ